MSTEGEQLEARKNLYLASEVVCKDHGIDLEKALRRGADVDISVKIKPPADRVVSPVLIAFVNDVFRGSSRPVRIQGVRVRYHPYPPLGIGSFSHDGFLASEIDIRAGTLREDTETFEEDNEKVKGIVLAEAETVMPDTISSMIHKFPATYSTWKYSFQRWLKREEYIQTPRAETAELPIGVITAAAELLPRDIAAEELPVQDLIFDEGRSELRQRLSIIGLRLKGLTSHAKLKQTLIKTILVET